MSENYYNKSNPNTDEIVFVKIKEFSENGTYCEMIEYSNKEGFIPNTELDRKVKDPKKCFKFEVIYPVLIVSNDYSTYLSYKRIKPDTREKLVHDFLFVSKLLRIIDELIYVTKLDKTYVYNNTIRKLLDNGTSNPIELFNNILKNPNVLLEHMVEEYPDLMKEFYDNLTKRTNKSDMIVSKTFELNVLDEDAISKIKEILLYNNSIEIKHVSSPKYNFIVSAGSYDECIAKINDYMDKLKNYSKKYNCIISDDTDPTVISCCEYTLKFMKTDKYDNEKIDL